jgi:hypothetical protein
MSLAKDKMLITLQFSLKSNDLFISSFFVVIYEGYIMTTMLALSKTQ